MDSAFVLAMLDKTSSRFHIYESIRISEIRSITQGGVDFWYWISGTENVADLATRGCTTVEADSIWFTVPLFMREHPDKRPLKQTYDKNCSFARIQRYKSRRTSSLSTQTSPLRTSYLQITLANKKI